MSFDCRILFQIYSIVAIILSWAFMSGQESTIWFPNVSADIVIPIFVLWFLFSIAAIIFAKKRGLGVPYYVGPAAYLICWGICMGAYMSLPFGAEGSFFWPFAITTFITVVANFWLLITTFKSVPKQQLKPLYAIGDRVQVAKLDNQPGKVHKVTWRPKAQKYAYHVSTDDGAKLGLDNQFLEEELRPWTRNLDTKDC